MPVGLRLLGEATSLFRLGWDGCAFSWRGMSFVWGELVDLMTQPWSRVCQSDGDVSSCVGVAALLHHET